MCSRARAQQNGPAAMLSCLIRSRLNYNPAYPARTWLVQMTGCRARLEMMDGPRGCFGRLTLAGPTEAVGYAQFLLGQRLSTAASFQVSRGPRARVRLQLHGLMLILQALRSSCLHTCCLVPGPADDCPCPIPILRQMGGTTYYPYGPPQAVPSMGGMPPAFAPAPAPGMAPYGMAAPWAPPTMPVMQQMAAAAAMMPALVRQGSAPEASHPGA